jgi:putative CocE/NonD family hydrolase
MQAKLRQMVPTTGGIRLATDVWLPDGPGPFPVVLTRTPYHRVTCFGAARALTEWGYACVVQDCRGKYDSEGVFRPLVYEEEDGAATLDWIANQPWCNGRIGLSGASYLGMVQVPAAACGHEALRCISPDVCPVTYFTDWLRYGGCFALANAVRWSMTHAVFPTRPVEHFAWPDLWRQPTLEDVFARAGYECPELRLWVEHDVYDGYWAALDQTRLFGKIKVPGLHRGGWFDHITRGQFLAYQGIRDRGATPIARRTQRLLIGPWGHMTRGQSRYGEWEFGPDAVMDIQRFERRFLDLWLKDIDDGWSEEKPVRLFVMGLNRWVDFDDWPVPGARALALHLRSGGRAATLGGDGRLSEDAPGGESPDRYRYNPADPVPTLGGPIYWGLEPLGPVEQRPILGRSDVLYYRSDQLERPMAVVGPVEVELWVESSAPDTDFVAKLCVVEPSGRITVLLVGSMRCRYREGWDRVVPLSNGQPARISIDMGNLAYVFPRGSRVALIVTSSCYPRILPHPNTMAPTWKERNPQVATNEVLHDSAHDSRVVLPVVEL